VVPDPGKLASWQLPTAGMFFWMDIGIDCNLVIDDLLEGGVAVVPGGSFASMMDDGAGGVAKRPCSCFRASFTLIESAEKAEQAMMRVAAVLSAVALVGGEMKAVGAALAAVPAVADAVAAKEAELAVLRGQTAALEAEIAALKSE